MKHIVEEQNVYKVDLYELTQEGFKMGEQQRLPARVDLEEFAAAITRGVLRATEAQRLEIGAEATQPALFNPIIRLGIWIDVIRGGGGVGRPEVPGPLGGPAESLGAEGSGGVQG